MKSLTNNKGVIIIFVLSILAVFLVVGLGFILRIRLENRNSVNFNKNLKVQYVLEAAMEHAKYELLKDKFGNDSIADYNDGVGDEWYDWDKDSCITAFTGGDVDIDEDGEKESNWLMLRDEAGDLVGRYAVLIEDESGKLNLNVVSKVAQDGVSVYELKLEKFLQAAEIIQYKKVADAIVDYRYGADKSPGFKDIDDDNDNYLVSSDSKDNDADAVVDELYEGIDELDENSYHIPWGDDRIYEKIEQIKLAYPEIEDEFDKISQDITVYSFFNNVNANGQPRIDINTTTDASRLYELLQAKDVGTPSQKALNLIDYRDKNNIVSSLATQEATFYGVEAININEYCLDSLVSVHANAGSVGKEDVNQWQYNGSQYFINDSFAEDTWVFTGLAKDSYFRVVVYSDVPESDGYYVNNKRTELFDEEGKFEVGILKSDARGELAINCKDDGDASSSYFSRAEFQACEFLEIVNIGQDGIDLIGCYLEIVKGGAAREVFRLSNHLQQSSCVLMPGQYLIITNDKELLQKNYGLGPLVVEISNLDLNECSGTIFIKDQDDNLIVVSDNMTKSGMIGVSMERNDPLYDGYARNMLDRGSAGAQNSCYDVFQKPRLIKNNDFLNIAEILDVSDGRAWGSFDQGVLARIAEDICINQVFLEVEYADVINAQSWQIDTDISGNRQYTIAAPNIVGTWHWDVRRFLENGFYRLILYGQGKNISVSVDGGIVFSPGLDFDVENTINFGYVNIQDGMLQLKLKNSNEDGAGIFFDRICITPVKNVYGGININTASKNVLQALPGITEEFAEKIIESRPFHSIGDLLSLEDFPVSVFAKIANFITTRSCVYKIRCFAQVLGGFNTVVAEKKVDVTFER